MTKDKKIDDAKIVARLKAAGLSDTLIEQAQATSSLWRQKLQEIDIDSTPENQKTDSHRGEAPLDAVFRRLMP